MTVTVDHKKRIFHIHYTMVVRTCGHGKRTACSEKIENKTWVFRLGYGGYLGTSFRDAHPKIEMFFP